MECLCASQTDVLILFQIKGAKQNLLGAFKKLLIML